jgi:decaprenylphospho-beta-D-erythro-pentofuranosid-2-ulose 2-reductase
MTVARILLIGGTSAIGRALVTALGDEDGDARRGTGPELSVTVRDPARFVFPDGVRPGRVSQLDLTDSASIRRAVQEVFDGQGFDLVIVAAATLGPAQHHIDDDPAAGRDLVRTNLTGTVALIDELIEHLGHGDGGEIVFLSSIAMVRRRPSNALYGDTKRAVERHLAQRRAYASRRHVRLRVLRLGFVHTPMTRDRRPVLLARMPADVATDAARALQSHRNVLWVPSALRWVALALLILPRRILERIER